VNLCGAKKPIPANSHPFSLHQKGQLNWDRGKEEGCFVVCVRFFPLPAGFVTVFVGLWEREGLGGVWDLEFEEDRGFVWFLDYFFCRFGSLEVNFCILGVWNLEKIVFCVIFEVWNLGLIGFDNFLS
jgi:hypothetical protein